MMAFDFESVTDQSKRLVLINVHALPNTLDISTYLLSQCIQRKQENTSSNSILSEYSVIVPLIINDVFKFD